MADVVNVHELNGVEVITQAADGLYMVWADLDVMKEQDVNPQIMEADMFAQLTNNVGRRGSLESVPLCAVPAGATEIEIVSGHKRTRAARAAGIKRVIILLDVSGLSRSAVAAKVAAHNNIHGYTDQEILAQLAKEITDLEDRLEAFLPPEIDGMETEPMEPLLSPHLDIEWRVVSFSFLADQMETFNELIAAMQGPQDLVAVADVAQFEGFSRALADYARFREVKSANQAVAMMIKTTRDLVLVGEEQYGDGEWAHISQVLGVGQIPAEVASDLEQVVKDLEQRELLTKSTRWRVIEYLLDAYHGMAGV